VETGEGVEEGSVRKGHKHVQEGEDVEDEGIETAKVEAEEEDIGRNLQLKKIVVI